MLREAADAAPRRAPVPKGPFSGRRTAWRRAVSLGLAWVNRALVGLPAGGWMRRRLMGALEIPTVEVGLRRGGPGLAGLKVAFLTDLHAGSVLGAGELAEVFGRVATEGPDLVCLGGDLINTRDRELLLLRDGLSRLGPPLGVFAVPGNHDHFWGRDLGLWCAFLREMGVTALVNAGHRVVRDGAGLWVAGVDDLTEGAPDLRAALEGARDDEPVLLLSHHPDFFFEAAAVGVDLTLSGHTHGGQIRPIGRLLRHTRFGWWEGMFQEEGCRLYVSRGVGVTLLPLRAGAPPEVPILRLRPPG